MRKLGWPYDFEDILIGEKKMKGHAERSWRSERRKRKPRKRKWWRSEPQSKNTGW